MAAAGLGQQQPPNLEVSVSDTWEGMFQAARDTFSGDYNPFTTVHGEPFSGHRVDALEALIITNADGSEGLVSAYILNADRSIARITFVASTKEILEIMRPLAEDMDVPEGASLQWRTYQLVEIVPEEELPPAA